jgi:CheY-like chemotaxis protein
MLSCEEIERVLRDTLAHLYDPDYHPSSGLCPLIGCDSGEGAIAVQAAIMRLIEDLRPDDDIPHSARTWQFFDVLHDRYVLKLTQEETGERLHMSVSSVRRAQREAEHALAQRIWDRHNQHSSTNSHPHDIIGGASPAGGEGSAHPDWQSLVQQNLASLHDGQSPVVVDVGKSIIDIVELEKPLTSSRGLDLRAEEAKQELIAAIHPSVLRQILVMAIGMYVEPGDTHEITIRSQQNYGRIQLQITGPPSTPGDIPSHKMLEEMVMSQGGDINVVEEERILKFYFDLPAAGDITVLVVDDNPDTVYYYRRCVESTRYRIVNERQGRQVFSAFDTHKPDVIVLDIMLPDTDGWELLSQLHQYPSTRSIPIIVASVIKERDLALSLGATDCLFKPVEFERFLQALDQATSQVSEANLV